MNCQCVQCCSYLCWIRQYNRVTQSETSEGRQLHTLLTSSPLFLSCCTFISLYPPVFISPSKFLSSSLVSLIVSPHITPFSLAFSRCLSPPPPLLFTPYPLLVWKGSQQPQSSPPFILYIILSSHFSSSVNSATIVLTT